MNDCKNANDVSMLLKLIVVNSQHVVRCKSKITHCSANSTLSEYIAAITLEDGKKNSIDEVPEVLIGAGSFTNMSCFDKQNLQVVTMEELRKAMPGGLIYSIIFHFKLVVLSNVYLDCLECLFIHLIL